MQTLSWTDQMVIEDALFKARNFGGEEDCPPFLTRQQTELWRIAFFLNSQTEAEQRELAYAA